MSQDQKEERVRTFSNFAAAVRRTSMAFLNRNFTMDETMVSFHTPVNKIMSKQWINKGQLGPISGRDHVSLTKQMVLLFFAADRLIYTKMVKQGQSVNATFNVDTLDAFLKILKQQRPQLVEQGWIFH